MKRIRRAVAASVLLLVVSTPASAQEAVEIDASIGLQGYVDPYETATMSVRVRADVLFVGDLQITVGGVTLFSPIEVPAGSTKDYQFDVPAPGPTGRARVRLFAAGSEEHLAEESVTVLQPGAEPLVGLLDAPAIESALTGVRSVPFDRSLEILSLDSQELTGDLSPLAYLVVGEGALVNADPNVLEAVAEWVTAGGRLVGEVTDLGRIPADATGPAAPLTAEATTARSGAGELIVVAALSGVTDWGGIVRDVPPVTLGSNNEFFPEFGFQMVEAASSGGQSVAPGIPWLLGALAAYVLLAGPVNFMILRRVGRRELAWITIPAVSIAMLLVLWLAGRSQLDDRIVTHASIVMQDGNESRAMSSMIVVAGGQGEHSLDVPADWSIAPLDVSMMFGQGAGLEAKVGPAPGGGTRMGFELPNLGAATVSATWRPEPVALTAAVEVDDDKFTANIFNASQLEFWAWGIADGSSATVGSDPLQPGGSDTISLRPSAAGFNEFGPGGSIIADSVLSQRNWEWDGSNDPWQKVWPLADAMSRREGTILQAGPYFFGYTDDLVAEVAVDGGTESAKGPTLLVIPLEVPASVSPTQQPGEIVQIVGADFVDAYPGWVYASGADAIEMRFEVAAGTTGNVTIKRQGGHLPGVEHIEVYNWQARQFDEYDWPGDFPLNAYVSPTRELMARIVLTQADFNDMELPTGSLTLSMESS